MTDTTTTKPPAAPRQATTRRPQVSVRPVLVGAANAAVIGGATVVTAGGGLVLAAAGAGAAAVGAAAASRKGGKARAAKQERTITFGRTSTSGSGGGLPRAGRSSAASPGRASSGGRAGSGAGSRGGSGLGSLFGKNRAGSGATGGTRSGGPGGRAGGRGAGLSGGSGRSGGSGGAGFRRAGSGPGSTSRSPLSASKVAAARRKLANRRQPGPRLSDAVKAATTPTDTGKKPTAREAWSSARKAVTGDNPKRRGTLRRAAAGLAAGAIAWDKTQRANWRRRKQQEAARKAKQDRIDARAKTKPGVRHSVRKPGGQGAQGVPGPFKGTIVAPHKGACVNCRGQILKGEWVYPRPKGWIGPCCTKTVAVSTLEVSTPVAKPAPITTQPGRSTPAPATSGGAMSRQLLALSEDFLAAAGRNQAEGMLQVTAEAHMMPQVIDNLARALKIRYDQAMEYPLHPVIKDMYGAVHVAEVAVVRASEEIGPQIERIHKEELDRLRNPNMRGDESHWDIARNQGGV